MIHDIIHAVILAVWSQSQDGHEFEVSLSYIARSCLKKKGMIHNWNLSDYFLTQTNETFESNSPFSPSSV
jgi:hypothetical protein